MKSEREMSARFNSTNWSTNKSESNLRLLSEKKIQNLIIINCLHSLKTQEEDDKN